MKPLSLNLSTMTKIAQDKHSATFKHSNGHEIKILLSALPAIQRDQVKKLPLQKVKLEGGGDVNPTTPKPTGDTKKPPEQTSDPYDQTLSNGWDNLKKAFTGQTKKAHGGDVKMYADSEERVAQDDSAPTKDDTTTQDPNPGDGGLKDAELEKEVQDAQVQPQASASGMVREQQERPAIAQPEVTPVENMANPNGTANQPQVIANEAKNLQDKANIAASAGAQQAALNTGYQKQLAVQADQDVQDKTDMEKHVKEFEDWKKDNKFNERAYLDNMSTGKKISTAIGLFLGGFGQGLVGGNNPAMDFLQSRIADNIAGQKERFEQERNIFGAYMKEYDNKVIASNLTKVTLNNMLANELNNTANNLATPVAKNMANMATVKLVKENNDLLNSSVANRSIQRNGGTQIKGGAPGFQAPAKGPAGSAPKLGTPGAKNEAPKTMEADDPKWADSHLKPGSDAAPKANDAPQMAINYDKFKQSQLLGAKGVPGEIPPSEVGEANQAINYINSANQVIREIHKAFPEMWKHGASATPLTTGHVTIPGTHSDLSIGSMFPGMKEYNTAAGMVKKQIGNLMKGGLSPEVSELIQKQLVNTNDTPAQYREKLNSIDKLIMQSVPAGVVKKYNLVKGLPE